jgi:hypothetical protein
MAQLGWVYLDPHGGRHRIGLYHGEKTGHLLIHCNMRVIQVDFSVKESKSYSFFIEDELCELKVHKENGFYSYEFTTNRKVDTPLNRQRKALNRQNLKYVLWSAAALIVVIAGATYGLHRFDKWQEGQRFMENSLLSSEALTSQGKLATQGQSAVAHLFFQQEGKQRKVYYGFVTADSMRTTGQFNVPPEGAYLLPTGFPLADNDAFRVTYLPGNPKIHRVEFDAPARSTVSRYLQLAQTMEQQNHPQDTPEHIACLVLTAAEKNNWPVLAHFIFQGKTPEEDQQHNHDTYLKMLREPDMEALVKKECWDK